MDSKYKKSESISSIDSIYMSDDVNSSDSDSDEEREFESELISFDKSNIDNSDFFNYEEKFEHYYEEEKKDS